MHAQSYFLILLLSVLIFLPQNTHSQKQCKPIYLSKVSVDILPLGKSFSEKEKMCLESMSRKLKEHNILADPNEKFIDYEFSIGFKEIDEDQKYIASVVISLKLPKEVIELGVK